MGLCKCPKRKVTNLFCFEHRVNVCESCLVSNHESCVVQTYLSWLTDSDYDPNCTLCSEPLSSKETIRLKCFHVFHWSCLNSRASQLPNTTAPAGYKCPSCLDVIFPSINQKSPVIDLLREKLSCVEWAAAGLNTESYNQTNYEHGSEVVNLPIDNTKHLERNSYSAVNIENQSIDPFEADTFTSRKHLGNDVNSENSHSFGGRSSTVNLLEINESSDTKYAKRTSDRNRFNIKISKYIIKFFLFICLIFILYFIFFGRLLQNNINNDDPIFDPHANPNIQIN